MIEQQILEALQHSVTAAVAASTMPSLPVAYIGITFEPPADQKYIELIHIPNNPASRYWSDDKDYQGIFRIIIHWPIDGAGIYAPMRILQSIVNGYSKDMILENGVKITSNPDLTGVIEVAPELLLPCSLRYTRYSAAG